MDIRKIISEEILKLNEAYIDKDGNLVDMDYNLVDFKSFPPSVLKTLDNEYSNYQYNFDWNSKQDEYRDDPEGFTEFLGKNKSEQFLKNINNIIRMTIQDMIIKKRQVLAKKKLNDFEDLIIPAYGNKILSQRLTKYEELVLMNPDATPESIERGFIEAKNLIDKDGNINPLKTELSTIFRGGDVNLPAFERFVEKHPEYRKSFDRWKKLLDDDTNLMLKELNAFRESTSYERIKELRDFLINYKKQHNIK